MKEFMCDMVSCNAPFSLFHLVCIQNCYIIYLKITCT